MNSTNAKDYLPLVQALTNGEMIQELYDGVWYDVANPHFDKPSDRYRIRRKLLELWVNVYSAGDSGVGHYSEDSARSRAEPHAVRTAVHMKECE